MDWTSPTSIVMGRNVSLLVGMTTKNKKCSSLHAANRLGAR